MRNPLKFLSMALVALIAVSAAGPAMAGFDVDFGAAVKLNDRTDLFFRISSRYFDQDRSTITRVAARFVDPDDLAVALFIRHESGRSFDELYYMRQRGLTWWEISARCGVPVERWYVQVEQDPGPPYGKAYGYWKKHKRNPQRMKLSDVQCRDLVALRIAHEYYGVDVNIAANWRREGDIQHVMTERYWERHHGPTSRHGNDDDQGEDGNGQGHPGKGKGKGKGKK
jgi:hypothetical protein